jgi:hypothetical protein
VRRRHTRDACVRRESLAGVDVEPVRVDGNRNECRAGGDERAADVEIPGLFDPHRVTRIEQQSSEQIDRLLRPAGDHDLIGLAAYPTRRGDVRGDRFA